MGNVIACLGWGSLIWYPRELPIQQPWLRNGPEVRVELVRRSENNRITLVLHKAAKPVRCLWARMTVDTQPAAVRALTMREYPNIAKKTEKEIASWSENNIGEWSKGASDPEAIPGLGTWATGLDIDIDHVIWTALGWKFKGSDKPPTSKQVIQHLAGLRGCERDHAEECVRLAPKEIDTEYRQHIEAELGWFPCEGGSDSA